MTVLSTTTFVIVDCKFDSLHFGCTPLGKLPTIVVSLFSLSSLDCLCLLGNGPRRVLHAIDRPPWVPQLIFFVLCLPFVSVHESFGAQMKLPPGAIQSAPSMTRLLGDETPYLARHTNQIPSRMPNTSRIHGYCLVFSLIPIFVPLVSSPLAWQRGPESEEEV